MLLTYPHALWLVPLIAAVAWLTWPRSSGVRAVASYVLRLLALALLVFALTQPVFVQQQRSDVLIHLVDMSAAPPTALAEAVNARWQAAAARNARQWLVLYNYRADAASPHGQFAVTPDEVTSDALDAALMRADRHLSRTERGQIVVYTDGWLTGHDPLPLTAALAKRGVTLEIKPVSPQPPASCVLLAARLPSQARSGQTVTLAAQIGATQSGPATLQVTASDAAEPIVAQQLDLSPGDKWYNVELPVGAAGLRTFHVNCAAAWDTLATDNDRDVACLVAPPQEVVVVEPAASDAVSQALRSLLGDHATVTHVSAADLDEVLADARPPVIVWGNPPAAEIPAGTLDRLRTAVLDGTSLWTVGGRGAYDLAGEADTPLAELLPVDLQQTVVRHDPSIALVIIIDTSGSMLGARFDLAKETARLAIQRLKRHDKVGIVEFYGTKRWAARLQSAANGIDVYRALNRLNAGGGTVILPALDEAHAALLNVRAQLKHVLILTDGGVETGPFQRVITRMADDGITVSTVLVGPGQHSAFLADLAQWGRGRAYQAPDQFRVPEIILRRPTEQRRSSAVEQPATIALAQPDPVTHELAIDQSPPLAGYHRLDARPTADVLLRTADDVPLLARWRYGRGFVLTWLSDLGGPWAASLWDSPAGRTLAANIARQLGAANPPDAPQITLTPRLGNLAVDMRLETGSAAAQQAPLRVEVADGQQQTVDPVTPGHWNAWLPDVAPGTVVVTARNALQPGAGQAATALPPTEPRRGVNVNEPLLRELTDVAAAFQPRSPGVARVTMYRDIWPWLVLAALASFLLNVLVRRWPPRVPHAAARLLVGLVWLTTGHAVVRADDVDTDLLAQARQLELKDDPAGAAHLLATYTASDEDREQLLWWRALLLHDADERDAAVALLTTDPPTDSLQRRGRACLLAMLNEPQAALTLVPTNDAEPRDLIFASMLAQHLDRLDESAALLSVAAPQAATSHDRQFIAALRVVLAEQRDTTAALAQSWLDDPQMPDEAARPLFQTLWDLGRRAEALDLAARRGWLSGDTNGTSVVAREIATLVLESDDFDETSRAIASLLAREPENVRWQLLLARLQLARHADQDATATLLDAVRHAPGTSDLFYIADVADKAHLTPVVASALARILELDPDQHFRVALWQARSAAARGADDALTAALADATADAHGNRGRLIALADTLERLEHFDQTIALLAQLEAEQPDAALTERRAWLLERTGRRADALATWRTLWERTTSESQQRRAADRVLDLAARTSELADLAIEIEEHLAAGTAPPRELDLLLEIYIRIGDPISAGEILLLISDESTADVATLRRLAEAYLRMGQVGLSDQVLERLQSVDPERRIEYLQQRILLAIERKRPEEAEAHVHELTTLLGDSPLASELAASMYTLLEDHAAAAAAYAHTLDAFPERIELWLLWGNAMRSTNRTQDALERMRELVDVAEQDDLFLVAVDGLLNLDASPAHLRYALRRLQLRMAAAPQRVYLFDAAGDVLESLDRREDVNRHIEIAVAYNAEQRGDLIREMMDRSKALRDLSATLEMGTILILLDHHVPADVFIELGELLLHDDREADAARAFSRATALGDHDIVRQRVGRIFLENLRPGIAGRIFDEQLTSTPDDVELRMLAGAAAEQSGQFDVAFEHYRRAYELCVRQATGNQGNAELTDAGRRRQRIAVNVGLREQFLLPALDGLLSMARTADTQERLFALLTEDVTAASSDETSDGTVPTRLADALSALRRVAFGLNRAAVAVAADRIAIEQHPADTQHRVHVAKLYQDWGLVEFADQLAGDAVWSDPALRPAATAHLLRELTETGALVTEHVRPADVEHLLPALLMLGRHEAARQLMQYCETIAAQLDAAALQTLLAGCVVLGDAQALDGWLPRFVDLCGRNPNVAERTELLRGGLRTCWWSATPACRARVVRQIDALARGTPDDYQTAWLARQLADNAALTAIAPDQFKALATAGAANRGFVAELLNTAPADLRPTLLETIWSARPPNERAKLLAEVAADLDAAPDAALVAAYERLLQASPALRVSRHFPYRELVSTNWQVNATSPTLGTLFARTIRNWFNDSLPAQIAAVAAYGTAGDVATSAALAEQAFDQLLASGTINAESQRMLADLVDATPPETLERRRAALAALDAGTRGRFQQYVLGVIDMHQGREQDAVAALIDAFYRRPADRLVRRDLITYLADTHRWPQLVALLSAYVTDPAVMDSWERTRLADAYVQCGAPERAAAVLNRDNSTLASLWLMELDAHAGDQVRALRRLRQRLINNRLERRFFAPNAQYDEVLGGLEGYLRQRARAQDRPLLYTALAAQLPAAADEFLTLYHTATPDELHLQRLAQACWRGVTEQFGDRAFDVLRPMFAHEPLTLPTLAFLATSDESATQMSWSHLPATARQSLVVDWQACTATLAAFAQADLRTVPGSDAREILHWLIASDLATARPRVDARIRLAWLDTWLATLPEEQRGPATTTIVAIMQPLPGETRNDALDAWLLQRAADCNQPPVDLAPAALVRSAHLTSACARAALRAADWDAFTRAVDALVRQTARFGRADYLPLNPLEVLPTSPCPEPERAANVIAQRVLAAHAEGHLTSTSTIRILCLAAWWCAEQDVPGPIRGLIDDASTLASAQPDSSWLWIADAERRIDPDAANARLETLAAAGLLTARRLERLLQDRDEPAGDALLYTCWPHLYRPAWLDRALRHADAIGDQAAVAGIQRRLLAHKKPR